MLNQEVIFAITYVQDTLKNVTSIWGTRKPLIIIIIIIIIMEFI